ncbi:MAG: hypothetical protein HPY62_13385, partial [Bacteroidales bacterium]|nr:hypothetical protein [Bacteroidales bacterium]
LIAYLVFLLIATIGIVYGNIIIADYPSLRIWKFSNLLVMMAGIPFVLFQSWSGIPDFLDRKISNRERYIYPVVVGLIFGILDLVVIRFFLHPEAYNEMPPFIQPFPYSVFLYFSGAFEVEVFYRLVPLTIILLIGKIFQKGRYLNAFFIAGAILTSLREPLEQMPSGPGWFTAYSLITGFLMNLMQAIFFRKSGFISSLSLRLGHYLIWHILHGIYIQLVELP